MSPAGDVDIVFPGGGPSIDCGTSVLGVNVVSATKDVATTGTLRCALDNNVGPSISAIPAYVTPTSGSVARIGNDDTAATAFSAGAVLWVQGYASVLSDADLARKSGNGAPNASESSAGFHDVWVPVASSQEGTLAEDWEIGQGRDWNGVGSTSTSGGSGPVTYTVAGSPSRASLSAQVVTETAAHSYILDNGVSTFPWSVHARYVVSTTAGEVCIAASTGSFYSASTQ